MNWLFNWEREGICNDLYTFKCPLAIISGIEIMFLLWK